MRVHVQAPKCDHHCNKYDAVWRALFWGLRPRLGSLASWLLGFLASWLHGFLGDRGAQERKKKQRKKEMTRKEDWKTGRKKERKKGKKSSKVASKEGPQDDDCRKERSCGSCLLQVGAPTRPPCLFHLFQAIHACRNKGASCHQ